MSRCYREVGEGGIYAARGRVKPYSPKWVKAREARAARRSGQEMKPRTAQGFIIERAPAGAALRDPGPIDRWLWLRHQGT
jgi:hypothetical protein